MAGGSAPPLLLAIVLLLAAAGFALGWSLLRLVLHRVRVLGTLSQA